MLAAVSGQPLTALDECLAAGVLRDGGAEVVFRHELAREAVAASLLPGRRRALHRAAYDALRASARADDRRLAHHAAFAGDGPNVIVHAPRAATLAAALGAHREAAEHYRAALRWGHLLDDAGRADLLERLSYECYLTGQLPEASDARAAELALRRASGDPLRTGIGPALAVAACPGTGSATPRPSATRRRPSRHCPQLPDGPELAMAYSNMAQLRMLADDTEGAQEWGNRAVELARRFGDVDTEVHALNNVGTALMIAGDERGATILQESLDTALAHDLQEHVARAYTNLGATLVKHRRYAAGEDVLRAGHRLLRRPGPRLVDVLHARDPLHPAPRDRALGRGAVARRRRRHPVRGDRQPRQRAHGAGQARHPHRRRPGGRGRGLAGWPSRRARRSGC